MAAYLDQDRLCRGTSGVSRREFIKGVGAAVAGATLLAAGYDAITTAAPSWAPDTSLVRATFSRHRGDIFHVYMENNDAGQLQLAEVRDLRSGGGTSAAQQADAEPELSFSLLFTGALDKALDQGTYHLKHDQIGNFLLFLVPMMSDGGAHRYEAIFNRLPAEATRERNP